MNDLTELEKLKLKHMLGAGYKTVNAGFRNYFASGQIDMPVMESLVSKGMAKRGAKYHDRYYYHATNDGCKAAGLTDKQRKEAMGVLYE